MSAYEGPSVSHAIFGWEGGEERGVPKMWQSRTECIPRSCSTLVFYAFLL